MILRLAFVRWCLPTEWKAKSSWETPWFYFFIKSWVVVFSHGCVIRNGWLLWNFLTGTKIMKSNCLDQKKKKSGQNSLGDLSSGLNYWHSLCLPLSATSLTLRYWTNGNLWYLFHTKLWLGKEMAFPCVGKIWKGTKFTQEEKKGMKYSGTSVLELHSFQRTVGEAICSKPKPISFVAWEAQDWSYVRQHERVVR